jgi:nucleotide-binding universal stress UspA family protein
MAYKSILSVIDGRKMPGARIDAAVSLARAEDAHLEIVCFGIDRTQAGVYFGGAGTYVASLQFLEEARAEAAAVEAEVRSRLSREDIRWSVESGVVQPGLFGPAVGARARYNDLVVMSPPYGDAASEMAEAVIEGALFDGRAPVLILPGGEPPAQRGRVVLAWNEGEEAMAAARAALPWLKAASLVDIAVIDPPADSPERSDPGGALSQWLARHGVKTEVSVLARTSSKLSEVLLRHARDMDARMVVMGAYGHSRFREAILGGMTRDMLESAALPVFMAR